MPSGTSYMKDKVKEFKYTSWSIDNKTSIFLLTILLTLFGITSYISLPKEKFPDIVVPTISVTTIYPGTSPTDIENLITKPIEKKIKAINGVKKLTSNSIQNASIILVEFDTDKNVEDCKRKVKDAVDKSIVDLPNDPMRKEPEVKEFDFAERPIMNVNLAGDFDVNKLKQFAEILKDKIEALPQITRVDIVGALDREIHIDMDLARMQAAGVTMSDVENAVKFENATVPTGNIKMDELNRAISVKGQFVDPRQMENLIIRSMNGAVIYLKDIAEVKDSYHERESYSRLEGKNVVTLNVIKRSGENLIESSDKIRDIISECRKTSFPKELDIRITGDQSDSTRVTLHDLINTIIIGFILVTLILMFFMGATNAIFVGLSVPLSMFLAFLVMPTLGFSLNMIVLFSFLLALGIVVDDAIVVIENTHRIFDNGKVPIVKAAKMAAGEVFVPVLAGTLTTLAPFIPLAFWKGIIGKFMFYLPITLIVTLLASLVVAYIFNPVFAVQFMKPHHHGHETDDEKLKTKKNRKLGLIIFGAVALISYISGNFFMGNLTITIYLLILLHRYVLEKTILKFQNVTWPSVQNYYERVMSRLMKGKRPQLLLFGTVILLFFSFFLMTMFAPKVVFFPKADPNFVNVFVQTPIGSDVSYTDSVAKIVENRAFDVVGPKNPLVQSIICNVAVGANDPGSPDQSNGSHKALVSVAFVEFSQRNGQSTNVYLDKMREAMKGLPGVEITVDQEQGGPPVGKPISIEITGDNLVELTNTAKDMKRYLDSCQIPGVEELKSDLVANKPEVSIVVDRERALREGLYTGQVGNEIRKALAGYEVSKFRDDNEDYPIVVRLQEKDRDNLDDLMNMKIIYRDMIMMGQVRQIPISAIAKIEYTNSYGGIKRKNQNRIVTLSSNVLSKYNANEVVAKVKAAITNYKYPSTVQINFGGEQEEQKKTGAFLGSAMGISLLLIILILVTQFNSLSKPLLILSEILFSIIGVLLGFMIFRMDFSIIMTGIGIVALAGIVVRNGILLVEFTDQLMEQGWELKAAVIEAGKTRMTPVLLTASATILGLVPLAVGLNIDFYELFAHGNPHLFFGGDSVAFWGPLSWTMIFGLSFATFLTLILVPAMYFLNERTRERILGRPRKYRKDDH